MFLSLTGYANNSVAFKYLTITAYFFYRRANFHDKRSLYFFFLAFFALKVTRPLVRS
jgi:hypothetical protein